MIVLSLLVGSVPGVYFGSRMAQHVPTGPLRLALALLLVGTGLKLAIG